MRKIITKGLFIVLFVVFYKPMEAQRFQGLLVLGGNLSQIDGDEVYGFRRFGLNTGVGVLAPLGKTGQWQLSLEVLYSQKGARETDEPFPYDCRLHYIDLPLMVHFHDLRGGWTFGIGFQYGRLLKINEHWNLPNPPIQCMERPKYPIPGFLYDDFNLVAGIRFGIWKRLKMDIRYHYSLKPIRENITFTNGLRQFGEDGKAVAGYKEWQRNMRNSVLSLRFIYVFNERSGKEKDRNIQRDRF